MGGSVSSATKSLLAGEDWLAENIRATLFTTMPVEPNDLLANIAGLVPLNLTKRPGLHFESAEFEDGSLYVTVQPGRFDLTYADKTDPSSVSAIENPHVLNVGPLNKALRLFRPVAEKVFPTITSVARIGVGVIAIKIVDNNESAARVIKEYNPQLPVNPSTDSDIFWQYNRPRITNTFGGTINRLVKWQAVQQQLVRIIIPGPVTASTEALSGQIFVRMEGGREYSPYFGT